MFLRQKRAQIRPNSGFISQLKDFEKRFNLTNNIVENFCGCNRPRSLKK